MTANYKKQIEKIIIKRTCKYSCYADGHCGGLDGIGSDNHLMKTHANYFSLACHDAL
jgi:hypothetical protein